MGKYYRGADIQHELRTVLRVLGQDPTDVVVQDIITKAFHKGLSIDWEDHLPKQHLSIVGKLHRGRHRRRRAA